MQFKHISLFSTAFNLHVPILFKWTIIYQIIFYLCQDQITQLIVSRSLLVEIRKKNK